MKISKGKKLRAQKVTIYGPEGIGKTTFAAKFPDPLFIDTEGSTSNYDVKRSDPSPTSWSMLFEQVKYVIAHPDVCKTLVIDTADWAEMLCINAVIAKGLPGKKIEGIEDFGWGQGYTYVAEEFARLLNTLDMVIDKGINVVITAHAALRKVEEPGEFGKYDRWALKTSKKVEPLIKEWADALLFVNYVTMVVKSDSGSYKGQGGKRFMFANHTPEYDGKNRYGLEGKLDFDYEVIRPFIEVEETVKPETETVIEDDGQAKIEVPQGPKPRAKAQPKKDFPKAPSAPQVEPHIKKLKDLMEQNNVTEKDIEDVVAARGYYPKWTTLDAYEKEFVEGVLIGAWEQVYGMIQQKTQEEVSSQTHEITENKE